MESTLYDTGSISMVHKNERLTMMERARTVTNITVQDEAQDEL